MHRLWGLIAKTSAVQLYGLLISLGTVAITARWLGPSGRGNLSAVLTWAGTFATIFYFSLGQVAVRDAAKKSGANWFHEAFGALLFWLIVTTVLGVVSAVILWGITGGRIFGGITPNLLLLGLLMLPFMIWERYSSFLLTALERLGVYNRNQIIGKSVGILLLILLVVGFNFGIVGALVATVLGQAILSAGCLVSLWLLSDRRPNLFDWQVNSRYLKNGLSLHLNAIGSFLFTASDILMLNYYRGPTETGYYQLGAQLTGIMMILPQAANMVIYGKISALGPDGAWAYQRKLLGQITLLVVLGAAVAGITAPWWLVWFAGESFKPTVAIFQWQLLSVIGMTFSVLMSSQWIGRGYFWQASLMTLVVGIGNIAANSVLIPVYGMYGAIWASLSVYMISIFGNGWMIVHCQKQSMKTLKEDASPGV